MSDLTDEEKIAWLWSKVDTLSADNKFLSDENDALKTNISKLKATITQLSKDIAIMGVELNSARTAAHDAVRDYIASKE